jgi:hypothetical protein
MSDRAALVGLVAILVVGVVAFAFVIDRATLPEPVTASGDPYTASNIEALLVTVVAQGDAQLTASAPTPTKQPRHATPYATTQSLEWCPGYGLPSNATPGHICTIPRQTPTVGPTWTPIQPCAVTSPRPYSETPCEL